EGAGPRLPHRPGSGPPLPPHVRQEPVLQLPARGAHARGPRAPLVGARRAQGPPARGDGGGESGDVQAAGPERRVSAPDYRDFYRGRKVLVTGGLGFIGSNLVRTLADLGARVLAVDSLL